jgi:hypothetical protein
MPSEAEIDALIERLGYHREHPLRGGYTLINPDGPEAAAFLAALRDERDMVLCASELVQLLHRLGLTPPVVV